MEITKKPAQTIILKNMQIPYNTDKWQPRNFRGLERVVNGEKVNAEGERNFCIFLDPEQVDCEQMIADGWNISKSENPRDPQAEPNYMLRVKVKYHPEFLPDGKKNDLARLNPKVRVVTQRGEMEMDEENIGDLDSAQIVKANLTINGTWRSSSRYTGYVAYLSKIVVRVFEDEGSLDDLMEGIMD